MDAPPLAIPGRDDPQGCHELSDTTHACQERRFDKSVQNPRAARSVQKDFENQRQISSRGRAAARRRRGLGRFRRRPSPAPRPRAGADSGASPTIDGGCDLERGAAMRLPWRRGTIDPVTHPRRVVSPPTRTGPAEPGRRLAPSGQRVQVNGRRVVGFRAGIRGSKRRLFAVA